MPPPPPSEFSSILIRRVRDNLSYIKSLEYIKDTLKLPITPDEDMHLVDCIVSNRWVVNAVRLGFAFIY